MIYFSQVPVIKHLKHLNLSFKSGLSGLLMISGNVPFSFSTTLIQLSLTKFTMRLRSVIFHFYFYFYLSHRLRAGIRQGFQDVPNRLKI